MTKYDGTINISRPSFSDGRKAIKILIVDKNSRIEFLELEIAPAEFALALTGLSQQPIKFEARALDKVGLMKESETIQFQTTLSGYRKDYQALLKEHPELFITPEQISDGWRIDTYLGSQNSIHKDGKVTYLNTRIYRYVQGE